MKEFNTYEENIIADTDKEVLELALETCADYFAEPLFKVGESEEKDFEFDLFFYNKKLYDYQRCWSVDESMSLEEALKSFDYLEEQFIMKILDKLNINYEIK